MAQTHTVLRAPERVSRAVTGAFRAAFQAHPLRKSDPALALDSARETASKRIPKGMTGTFDDERLTFTADKRGTR